MILIPQEKRDLILPLLTDEESQALEPLLLLERFQVIDDEYNCPVEYVSWEEAEKILLSH